KDHAARPAREGVDDVGVDGGDGEDAETEAEQLDDDAGGENVPAVEDAARHQDTVRRARATSASSASPSAALAGWTTLHRPALRRRSRSGRPSKSTETPPAPATIGSAGIRLARFSFSTMKPPPCDSIQGRAPRQPSKPCNRALRLPYWRTMSKAPPSCRLISKR